MSETIVIDANYQNLGPLRQQVKDWALAQGADPTVVEGLILALDESVTNVMMHGYRGSPGQVEIRLSVEEGDLVIRVTDQAPLFDPTTAPSPDVTLPLEQRISGGLGIFLARGFTDQYTYRVNAAGLNELTLRKKIR